MTVLLFFAPFAFYLFGLCGAVPSYRDSGDLIASIHTLGIAHPPGYAFYVLIGKAFVTLLPWGNVAYRVNVLSAFFAAATVALLYRVVRRLIPPPAPSVAAFVPVALFALSPAVIALAQVAEMYTLASFFAAAIVYGLLQGTREGLGLAAFLLGLGMSVHPTLVFLLPLFFVLSPRPRFDSAHRPELVEGLPRSPALLFLLGLTVFLFLPIRASQDPWLNWGDPSSWRNFWRVVTRADYGGLKLHPEQSVMAWTFRSTCDQLVYFFKACRTEWGWGALAMGIFGIVWGLKTPSTRRVAGGLFGSWLLAGPCFFLLSNLPLQEATTPAILQPYMLLVGLLWMPLVALGCARLLSLRGVRRTSGGLRSNLSSASGNDGLPRSLRSLAMTSFILLIVSAGRNWAFPSQRYDFYAYDYARNLLRSLPPRSVLYEPDDPTDFTLRVLQTLEGRRPDVVLLNFFRTRWGYEQIKRRWPDLLPPVPIPSAQELQRTFWSYSIRQRPFFAELPQKLGRVPARSQALVYAADPFATGTFSTPASRARAENLFHLYVMRGDFWTPAHADFFTRHLVSYYAAAHNNLGVEYANAGDWTKAVEQYRRALAIEPDQIPAMNNLKVARGNEIEKKALKLTFIEQTLLMTPPPSIRSPEW